MGDFAKYLLHPDESPKTLLHACATDGTLRIVKDFPPSGWRYRRARIMYEQAYQEQLRDRARNWQAELA